MSFPIEKWWFSIVTLVYQRVNLLKSSGPLSPSSHSNSLVLIHQAGRCDVRWSNIAVHARLKHYVYCMHTHNCWSKAHLVGLYITMIYNDAVHFVLSKPLALHIITRDCWCSMLKLITQPDSPHSCWCKVAHKFTGLSENMDPIFYSKLRRFTTIFRNQIQLAIWEVSQQFWT